MKFKFHVAILVICAGLGCYWYFTDKKYAFLTATTVFMLLTIEEVMTGKEFCDILGIDYGRILELRKNDTMDNFAFVVEQMAEISEIKKAVVGEQRKHINQNEFYDDDLSEGDNNG